MLLDAIIGKLGATEITLCDLALREGLVLDYIHRHRKEIARVDRYPDVRRRSAIELAERCHWEADHAKQVARMALSIFEQTRHLHELGEREQEWLEYASLLHDVGNHISYERHHRHSYYLIKNGDLRGFEPDEIEVIALVARYHRRGTPKRDHDGYGDLPAELEAHGPRAGGDPARGRVAGPIAPRGGGRAQHQGPRRRSAPAARGARAMPSWRSGPAAASWRCSKTELGKPIVVTKVDREPPPGAARGPRRPGPAGDQQLSPDSGNQGSRPWAAIMLEGKR